MAASAGTRKTEGRQDIYWKWRTRTALAKHPAGLGHHLAALAGGSLRFYADSASSASAPGSIGFALTSPQYSGTRAAAQGPLPVKSPDFAPLLPPRTPPSQRGYSGEAAPRSISGRSRGGGTHHTTHQKLPRDTSSVRFPWSVRGPLSLPQSPPLQPAGRESASRGSQARGLPSDLRELPSANRRSRHLGARSRAPGPLGTPAASHLAPPWAAASAVTQGPAPPLASEARVLPSEKRRLWEATFGPLWGASVRGSAWAAAASPSGGLRTCGDRRGPRASKMQGVLQPCLLRSQSVRVELSGPVPSPSNSAQINWRGYFSRKTVLPTQASWV